MDKFKVKRPALEIVQIKISFPFLEIFSRETNVDSSDYRALRKLQRLYEKAPNAAVELGHMYITELRDQFERVIIKEVNSFEALVFFVDCGFNKTLQLSKLKILNDSEIRKLDSQYKRSWLAGMQIVAPTDNNIKEKLKLLHNYFSGNVLSDMTVVQKTDVGNFTEFRIDGSPHAEFIKFNKYLCELLHPIDMEDQITMIRQASKSRDELPAMIINSSQTSDTDEEEEITNIVQQQVTIASCDAGPLSFYVLFTSESSQRQYHHDGLQKLKGILAKLQKPEFDMICIAEIDGAFHRARIIKVVDSNKVSLRLLDSGEVTLVKNIQLFVIPSMYKTIQPPFAKRFKLAGLDTDPFPHLSVHESDFYFNYITNNTVLTLKSEKSADDSLEADYATIGSRSCELYQSGFSIFDIIKAWRPSELVYQLQKHEDIQVGDIRQVNIVYVTSPNDFHVRLLPERSNYERLAYRLNSVDFAKLFCPKEGIACVVELGERKYRGLTIAKKTSLIFKVLLIDLGLVESFETGEIKVTTLEFVKDPPFAVACSLSGYALAPEHNQRMAIALSSLGQDQSYDNFVSFNMKVVKREGGKHEVELESCSTGVKVIDALNDAKNRETSPLMESLSSTIWTHAASKHSEWTDTHFTHSSNIMTSTLIQSKSDASNESENSSEYISYEVGTNLATEMWDSSDNCHTCFEYDSANFDDLSPVKQIPKAQDRKRKPLTALTDHDTKLGRQLVRIASVANPNDFTILKQQNESGYEKFKNLVQTEAKQQRVLLDFQAADSCLAFKLTKQTWLRVVICSIQRKPFVISVKCLDEGVPFNVTDNNHLKELPANLKSRKLFGQQCSLPIRYDEQHDREINEILIENKTMKSRRITVFNGINYVELYHDGENIANRLVQLGLAERLFIQPNGWAYINYVVSTSNFSVQMEQDSEIMNMMQRICDNYYLFGIDDPVIGSLVMAFDEHDNCWYRARLTSIDVSVKKFGVYYIDYGGSALVEKIGKIPDQLKELEPLSIICSLGVPWDNEEAEKKFKEIAANGFKSFQFEMVQPDAKAAKVKIYRDEQREKNIIDEIFI